MLDIGWSEFLVIGVVALIVIGPRDLPVFLRTAGRYAARVKAMAREFRDGLDDIAQEAEVKDLKNTISGGKEWSATGWMDDDKPAPTPPTALESTPAPADGDPATDGEQAAGEAPKPVVSDADEAALDAADFDDAQRGPAAATPAPDKPAADPVAAASAASEKDRPA